MIRLTHLRCDGIKQLREVELVFPRRCQVLVEGLNEAGKSTLFEAIFLALYGTGLAMRGGGRGQVESLIANGRPDAVVELGLSIEPISLTIRRRLRRGRPNEAEIEIEIESPQSDKEQVRGVRDVNQEILTHLNHLSSDALLASCFVQQKRLGYLEEVGRAERQDILLKLLDMDRLSRVRDQFRWTDRQERELESARKRYRLCEVRELSAEAVLQRESVERRLLLAQMHARFDEADGFADESARATEKTKEYEDKRNRLAKQITYLETLDQGLNLIRKIQHARLTLANRQGDLTGIQDSLTALERIEQDELPKLKAQKEELSSLEQRLRIIAAMEQKLEDGREKCQRLQQILEEGGKLEALCHQYEEAQRQKEEVSRTLHIAQGHETLTRWIKLRQEIVQQESLKQKVEELQHRVAETHGRVEDAQAYIRRRFLRTIAGGLAGALIGAACLIFLPQPVGFLVGLTLILASAAAAGIGFRRRQQDTEEASQWLREAEGQEREAREEQIRYEALRGEKERNLKEIIQQITGLGFPAPSSMEEAESLQEELARQLPDEWMQEELSETIECQQQIVRDREGEYNKLSGQIQDAEGRLQQTLQVEKMKDLIMARQTLEKMETSLPGLQQQIQTAWQNESEALTQWKLPLEIHEALRVAGNRKSGLESDIKNRQDQLQERGSFQERLGRLQDEISSYEKHIEENGDALYQALRALQDQGVVLKELEAGSEEQLLEATQSLRGYEDITSLRHEQGQMQGKAAASRQRVEHADEGRRLALEEAKRLVTQLGIQELTETTREAVAGYTPEFREVSADQQEELKIQREQILIKMGSLEDERNRLQNELGFRAEELDRERCGQELTNIERRKAISQRAIPILDEVRDNILRAVLPGTLHYMRAVLPFLTAGRYHDAELDEETYKIRVWDAYAREYVEKEIYSGATQDQFSLALRLGFALATLPQELGTRPGFLFLDEPTAGFDAHRRAALVELLTQGEIAQQFDQIFLAIPEGILQDNPFPHHIHLASGRVIQARLDGEPLPH